MSKKEGYKECLTRLFNDFLKTNNEDMLADYLDSNSHLPGPRGNLELAYSFAEVAEDFSTRDPHKIWELASRLISVSASEAPVNNPKEFLPFCGAVAIGVIGSTHGVFRRKAFALLKDLAGDSRWRTREGVAMGVQKLIVGQSQNALKELDSWIAEKDWLAMRAVAAGIAEPALLRDEQTARNALELHKKIFAQMLVAGERKTAEFRTLRQTLGYSLSVVTCASPEEGFAYMQRIVDAHDADVLWVIKENLKNSRLIRNFPNEVASTSKLLSPEDHH